MSVEWDPKKAAANVRKHGVSFADAVTVLEDEHAITIGDDAADEERWITLGTDTLGRVLVVVYTHRAKNIRLISARPATTREQEEYAENL